MGINYYDFCFYLLNDFCLKKYGEVKTFHRVVIVLFISMVEETLPFFIVVLLLEFQIINIPLIYFRYGLWLLLSLFNGIYFFTGRRWKHIVEDYKRYDNTGIYNKMRYVILAVIVICLVILFYWQIFIKWKVFN